MVPSPLCRASGCSPSPTLSHFLALSRRFGWLPCGCVVPHSLSSRRPNSSAPSACAGPPGGRCPPLVLLRRSPLPAFALPHVSFSYVLAVLVALAPTAFFWWPYRFYTCPLLAVAGPAVVLASTRTSPSPALPRFYAACRVPLHGCPAAHRLSPRAYRYSPPVSRERHGCSALMLRPPVASLFPGWSRSTPPASPLPSPIWGHPVLLIHLLRLPAACQTCLASLSPVRAHLYSSALSTTCAALRLSLPYSLFNPAPLMPSFSPHVLLISHCSHS